MFIIPLSMRTAKELKILMINYGLKDRVAIITGASYQSVWWQSTLSYREQKYSETRRLCGLLQKLL